MAKDDSTNKKLTESAPLREIRRQISRQGQYVSALQLAAALGAWAKAPADRLDKLRALGDQAVSRLQHLHSQSSGGLHPRHRPRRRVDDSKRPRCNVYLDECGSHTPKIKERDFDAFVLAAAIVRDQDEDSLSEQVREWKRSIWGEKTVILHEPELRRRSGKFWFSGDRTKAVDALSSLDKLIDQLPFQGIAVVVHRSEYLKAVRDAALDDALPQHIYLMALDFLCERIVMALDCEFGGAKGTIIAESRGPKEDATLQYEFVRLQLDGTSYVSDSWFRYQLIPGIVFRPKSDNLAGLQVADLMARPCGEKALDPTATPERWNVFRGKLVPTQKTANSPLGLKVMPWHERYEGIWLPKS